MTLIDEEISQKTEAASPQTRAFAANSAPDLHVRHAEAYSAEPVLVRDHLD